MEKKILCVGLACVDIISICDGFPEEDTDQRGVSQEWRRGGNASNNCTVLAQLGESPEYLGTMARSIELEFLRKDFSDQGVNIEQCVYHDDCHSPLSVVIVNQQNGSRTILHANADLPELTCQDFEKVQLEKKKYKWIHFECRPTVSEIQKMLQHIDRYNKDAAPEHRVLVSVEMEKIRNKDYIDLVVDLVDVLFISKDFAVGCGCTNMLNATRHFGQKCKPGTRVICAWGEKGAAGTTTHNGGSAVAITCRAFPPEQVVDTLGAGDTFNAGVIFTLSRGGTLDEAIEFGCRLAGSKCGIQGLKRLPLQEMAATCKS